MMMMRPRSRVCSILVTGALAVGWAATTSVAAAENGRASAPFDAKASVGLKTLQEAIASAGFHCPVAQTVTTALENARGEGLPRFVYKVSCRELGALDVDPNLTYRLQLQDRERRFNVRRLRPTD
jgi:hypothetical protein